MKLRVRWYTPDITPHCRLLRLNDLTPRHLLWRLRDFAPVTRHCRHTGRTLHTTQPDVTRCCCLRRLHDVTSVIQIRNTLPSHPSHCPSHPSHRAGCAVWLAARFKGEQTLFEENKVLVLVFTIYIQHTNLTRASLEACWRMTGGANSCYLPVLVPIAKVTPFSSRCWTVTSAGGVFLTLGSLIAAQFGAFTVV